MEEVDEFTLLCGKKLIKNNAIQQQQTPLISKDRMPLICASSSLWRLCKIELKLRTYQKI
jgi:hypothetical protein